MALIPLTFAYAIVRFRLFDVQVIVRKSLVYAVLTAVVTGMYALAVVAGNALVSTVSSTTVFSSPAFAFGFGLVVVLLFDPLRRRMQKVVDRLFFRDRADFQTALLEMSRSVVSQLERPKLRELLTARTADLLRLERLELLLPRAEDGAFIEPGGRGGGRPAAADGRGPAAAPRRARARRSASRRPTTAASTSPRGASSRRSAPAGSASSSRSRRTASSSASSRSGRSAPRRSSRARTSTTCSRSRTRARSASRPRASTRSSRAAPRSSATSTSRATSRRASSRASFRGSPGVEFFGVSRPARVVGGDFYDFLDVDVAAGRAARARPRRRLGQVDSRRRSSWSRPRRS